MDVPGIGQGQGGFGLDQILEMALNPLKIIQQIVQLAGQGGDSVSASQTANQTATITATEAWSSTQPSGYALGGCQASRGQVAKALEVLEENFDAFDAGVGKPDGVITLADLVAIANSDAPQDLKDAARLLLQNNALFTRLDAAVGSGRYDGQITLDAVRKVRADYERLLNQGKAGPTQGPGQSSGAASAAQVAPQDSNREDAVIQAGDETGPKPTVDFGPDAGAAQSDGAAGSSDEAAQAQSSLSAVLDDPSLSFEDKTTIVADGVMDAIEDDATRVLKDIADARDKYQHATTDQARRDAEVLERQAADRLQRLMQLRQEMFQLLSNMTAMFHDMAMAAIHNMKG